VTVEPISASDPAAERFVAMFRDLRAGLPGDAGVRDRAIGHFERAGFPTARVEEWKYTDLRRLARAEFAAPDAEAAAKVSAADIAPFVLAEDGPLAVFVEGRFAPALSRLDGLPQGVTVERFAEAADGLADQLAAFESPDGTGLVALNAALAADGAVIRVAKGVENSTPIQILHVLPAGSAAAVFPRSVILLDANASASVVESFAATGAAEGWTSAVTQVALGPGARLRHARIQGEDVNAWHVGLGQLRVERDARYEGFLLTTGARLSRTELRLDFAGEGAECDIKAACLLRGRQHGDITTRMDHAVPRCNSRQVVKSVLDDRARSVFQGRVHVAPDAQQTNADQLNRNLLLSPGAQADSKPELIIHADDVKCSHGATVGDLDRNALFYLQARGIDRDAAEAMLVDAFVRELLDGLPEDAVRDCIAAEIAGWLDGRTAEKGEAA
jgi:Fe-S cluster assembly protein SufD